MHSRRSRVVPGVAETMAPPDRLDGLLDPIRPLLRLGLRCCLSLANLYVRLASLHINRLNKVDFPALGGPKIDTINCSSLSNNEE